MNRLIGLSYNRGSELCCGCSACVNACPEHCLQMQADEEGFFYPVLDDSKVCIECNLCDKVCAVLHPYESKNALDCLGVKSQNENIREQSSSGGFFSVFAESIICNGGVVFGARFDDNWQVVLDYTEDIEGIAAFRGSKYVQACVGNTYRQAKDFLESGRLVLYSGTHCQIAGLHHYLRKEYDNLFTIDVVCHSVPSPLAWKRYLMELSDNKEIRYVNFRDKTTGWTKYGYNLSVSFTNGENIHIPASGEYMRCLTMNLSTRPSCSRCISKEGRSHSDITIGDYWGVWDLQPEFDDNKGVSLVVVNTDKARSQIQGFGIDIVKADIVGACKYNSGLKGATPNHPGRSSFLNKVIDGKPFGKSMNQVLKETDGSSLISRIVNRFKTLI